MIPAIGYGIVIGLAFVFFFTVLFMMTREKTELGPDQHIQPVTENPSGFEPISAEEQDEIMHRAS